MGPITQGMPMCMPVPHCPHCMLSMGEAPSWPFPRAAVRCPNCRLIVGPGRARADGSGQADARSRGSAAGVLANAARRNETVTSTPPEILAGLHRVAEEVGCVVERLRMLDYQEHQDADPTLPDLSSVLATFGTWKVARATAATERRDEGVTLSSVGAGDDAAALTTGS